MNGTPIAVFDPLKPTDAVQGAYGEIVSGLLAGQRAIGVLAAEPVAAAILLRTIPASKRLVKFRFLRFTPASPLRLTLENVAFQAGLDLPHGEISAAAMFATLKAHQPASGSTVLIVEGAETLTTEALEFFEQVATPSTSDRFMQLVLIGRGTFGELLDAERFPHLWSIVESPLAVASPAPVEAQPAAAEDAHYVEPAPFPAYAVAPPRPRLWPKIALGVAILAAGAALYETPWFSPVAPGRPPIIVPAPPAASPPAPPVPAPAAAAQPAPAQPAPAQPAPAQSAPALARPKPAEVAPAVVAPADVAPVVTPAPVETQIKPTPPPTLADPAAPPPSALAEDARLQLRQRFDAFLNRAGHDTAALTHEQRDALFEKYLATHPDPTSAP